VNLRKGIKRVVFILSLVPVFIGIAMFIIGLVDNHYEMREAGFLTAVIGFGVIWIIYGVMLYIIKGFQTRYCANCERELGRIEELVNFKDYAVCIECYKKLTDNKEVGAI